MSLRLLQFLAIILTALSLVPAGAHLFELPNKMILDEEQYFVVQSIYRGWSLFGFVLIPALCATIALSVASYRQRRSFLLAATGAICLAATLTVFFTFTYPANVATDNWTTIPDNWRALRTQWEYAHAANAVITFAGLIAVTLSALLMRRFPDASLA
jgi:hypothetical protein